MSTQSDRRAIRDLAYWLWEARGRRDGHAEEDWLEAETRILSSNLMPAAETAKPHELSKAVDESVRESFPASDPPSSHLPDKPPVNAKAKWDAAERHRGKKAAAKKAPIEAPKVGSKDAPGG